MILLLMVNLDNFLFSALLWGLQNLFPRPGIEPGAL